MSASIEIIIPEFGEMPDDEWDSAEKKAIDKYTSRLASFHNGSIAGSVETRNIGKGADWTVIVVLIGSTLVHGFFAVPMAHKYLRESIEEWRQIYDELRSLFRRLRPKRAFYPDCYLFLVALNCVLEKAEIESLVFQGVFRLPEQNPDLRDYEPLLFTFFVDNYLHQVAVSREGDVMWRNSSKLTHADV